MPSQFPRERHALVSPAKRSQLAQTSFACHAQTKLLVETGGMSLQYRLSKLSALLDQIYLSIDLIK